MKKIIKKPSKALTSIAPVGPSTFNRGAGSDLRKGTISFGLKKKK